MELLSVGPFCMINGEEPLLNEDSQPVLDHLGNTVYHQIPHYCSPNSTRTQRSGVTDVEYMIRPDREYWPVCFDSNPTHAHMHARVRFIVPCPCAASSSLRGRGSPASRATTSSCAAPT